MGAPPGQLSKEEPMQRIALALVALAALAAVVRPQQSYAFPGEPAAPPEPSRVSPLACDREALTPQERHRHFEVLGPALRKLVKGVHELPDGFELEFPADRETFAMLSEWVSGERLCCPFFDISLRSEREGGSVRLQLTGRDSVKQFIETEGKDWLRTPGGK